MKVLITILSIVSINASAVSYCSPARSKPCGQGCIGLDKTCRKSWTTSISGERPSSAKKGYATPVHVDTPPTGKGG